MKDRFNIRKFLTENRDWEQGDSNGFENFKKLLAPLISDEGETDYRIEDANSIEDLIELWASNSNSGKSPTDFYNHTQEDMVYLAKKAGLDFGDREALFNTDEVQDLEQGAVDAGEEELDEDKDVYSEEAIDIVKQLDAPEMEEFLHGLAKYFTNASNILTNMNAKEIATHLYRAHDLVKERTGN